MGKALILSSGGVDSTTCISIAVEKHGAENVSTVSFFYGQKHNKELECAEKIAEHYGVKHYVFDLSFIYKYSDCSLLKHSDKEISHKTYEEQIKEDGIVGTYVPFRNGLMLSIIATFSYSLYPNEEVEIYIGAHADDAVGNAYADCSVDFAEVMSEAIRIGTYEKVRVVAPLISLSKAEVVGLGLKLKTPYELTWSCYEGGEKPCGKCGTCIDRKKAFEKNRVEDPAL